MPRARKTLPREFFERPTPQVARDLIGCVLVRETPDGLAAGRIVETEAYLGEGKDEASHAHRGPTKRAAIMFGEAGLAYVYFSYGVHHCMNVVAKRRGHSGAVLIRAIEPMEGVELMRRRRTLSHNREVALGSGPGKLAQALAIGLAENGADLTNPKSPLRIEAGAKPRRVLATPRIGITKNAGAFFRFVDADSKALSKPISTLAKRRKRV